MKPQFSDILKNTFGSAPAPPIVPEPVPVVPPPVPPKPAGKSVNDPMVAAEAQRIYKPDMPPAAPNAGGVAPSMDLEGAWGKPVAQV